jgi:excisionase family DNA binding protein
MSKHDADRMIVTLTLAELGEVIDDRVRAAVRDELGRRPPPKPVSTCSVAEAARELGTSPRTVLRWVGSGRLQGSRAVQSGSSRMRIARDSVDRLVRDLTNAT